MGDFGNVIKDLYEKFILRDILSFVTPGAIIIVTATHLLFPEMFSRHIPWPFYIPLFGLFFMVGFAVQCFGEIIGFIRHGLVKSCWGQRLKIFKCKNWSDESNIWWIDAHERWIDFHKAKCKVERAEQGRHEVEWAAQGHERWVVLKQMCSNGFWAIVIAGAFLATNHWWSCANLFIVSLVTFLLLVSLFWGYRVHELRQYTWERMIIDKKKAWDTKKPKESAK